MKLIGTLRYLLGLSQDKKTTTLTPVEVMERAQEMGYRVCESPKSDRTIYFKGFGHEVQYYQWSGRFCWYNREIEYGKESGTEALLRVLEAIKNKDYTYLRQVED